MATPTRLSVFLQRGSPPAVGATGVAPGTAAGSVASAVRRASPVPSVGRRIMTVTAATSTKPRMLPATTAFRYQGLVLRDGITSNERCFQPICCFAAYMRHLSLTRNRHVNEPDAQILKFRAGRTLLSMAQSAP